jgi:hypothetical protein
MGDPNDLEDSEDRRSVGGHGNQHVRLRISQGGHRYRASVRIHDRHRHRQCRRARIPEPDHRTILPRMAETTGRSTRNSNWNSCRSKMFGSSWEPALRPITSAAFQASRIGASCPGRAFPWTCATGFSIGTAPFGFTFAVESHANRIDETTAAVVRSYGTGLTLAFDRELIPNVAVAALNLIYQPEWTRLCRHRGRRAGIDHRRRARPDGANTSGLLSRR